MVLWILQPYFVPRDHPTSHLGFLQGGDGAQNPSLGYSHCQSRVKLHVFHFLSPSLSLSLSLLHAHIILLSLDHDTEMKELFLFWNVTL